MDILHQQSDLTHFEGARGHIVAAAEPHLLDQVSIGLGDLPPHAQWILPVDLRLIQIIQEVVCERGRIAQALEKQKARTESISSYVEIAEDLS